jgi:monoamine oxidase
LKRLTRRDFFHTSGKAAGSLYASMLALDLLPAAPAHAFSLQGQSNGQHIIILGAGLAGLACAYELEKLGYRCTILEARSRVGGRCWSVRKNDVQQETSSAKQVATFDDGLYFNAGPSRIPHHHQLTLHYCKELGVPVEIYNNINEGAYYFAEGNGPLSHQKVRIREIHNDVRGYMSELLAKSVDRIQLDAPLTKADAEKIIAYLRAEGGLDVDKAYKASARRGYKTSPGADHPGQLDDPHSLADIIHSGLLEPDFYNVAEYTYELQMTMFQAVGGMDNIAKAFQRKITSPLKFSSEVTSVMNSEKGVKVIYKEKNVQKEIEGDFCVCTLPLPVLSNIDHNFSSDVSRAIDFIPYIATGKIGLQFKRRFWEEDEQIYGGITHTNNALTQIFYPSNNYLGGKGILIGYYNFNDKAIAVGKMGTREREALALEKGSLIHPQYRAEFESSFSVSWHLTPYNLGGWAVYSQEHRPTLFAALSKPDKHVYFAGEHTTYLNAWMAGAFESARKTVSEIHARVTDQRTAYPSKAKG